MLDAAGVQYVAVYPFVSMDFFAVYEVPVEIDSSVRPILASVNTEHQGGRTVRACAEGRVTSSGSGPRRSSRILSV